MEVPPPPHPPMLPDCALVKLSTAERQHHNTHKHKVYMPHKNLRIIRITQHNTNFHKTKSMVFCKRTDVSNNKALQNNLERKGAILKSNDDSMSSYQVQST